MSGNIEVQLFIHILVNGLEKGGNFTQYKLTGGYCLLLCLSQTTSYSVLETVPNFRVYCPYYL